MDFYSPNGNSYSEGNYNHKVMQTARTNYPASISIMRSHGNAETI